jgi:uncharacterized protein
MTPEERNLVIELFDRLSALEDAQRDPDAERLIRDGLRQAPNAPYALVQTVLVQDEALKRADARIRELEAATEPPPRDTSFLGGVRDSLLGRRGSVPSVRPGEAAQDTSQGMSPAWNTGSPAPRGLTEGYAAGPGQQGYPPGQGYAPGQGYGPGPAPMGQGMGQGGSFLGTAAAAAAGMIGGSMLLGGIRSMMGGHQGSARAAYEPGAGGGGSSPWAGGSAAGGELSREAGLNDIGRGGGSSSGGGDRGFGLVDDSHGDDVSSDGGDDQSADFDDGEFDGGDDGEE